MTEVIITHPYFLWNGVSSEDYGIMVSEYPVISRPKERVSQITIPGRSGVLMLPESDLPVYEPVLRTAQCWIRPDADIDAICAWLQGSGSVVFGNEPNRSYDSEDGASGASLCLSSASPISACIRLRRTLP